MKQLVDRGVYQYDDLQEAIKDAQIAADDSQKVSVERRRPETKYVLQDIHRDSSYYGPVNKSVRQSLIYREMEIVHTAEPEEKTPPLYFTVTTTQQWRDCGFPYNTHLDDFMVIGVYTDPTKILMAYPTAHHVVFGAAR